MPPGNQLSLEPVKLSAAFSQRAGRGGLLGGGGKGCGAINLPSQERRHCSEDRARRRRLSPSLWARLCLCVWCG